MKLNTVYYCYTLLCIVIFHTVVASPYAARRRTRSAQVVDAGSSAVDQPATLDDDVFGQNSHHGGEKDKRLIKLKPLKLGASALKAGAVGVGIKAAKKLGKVGVKAAAALGIKALIFNLLFGQINKIIDFKTRLLTQLDQQNRLKNAQYLGIGLPEQKPVPPTNPINQYSYVNQPLPTTPESVQFSDTPSPTPYIPQPVTTTLSPDQVQVTPAGYGSSEAPPNIDVRGLGDFH